jgi:hypothetical protein
LNPSNQNLKIHQDKIRGVYVTPLTEEVVTCPEDVIRIIERGEGKKKKKKKKKAAAIAAKLL